MRDVWTRRGAAIFFIAVAAFFFLRTQRYSAPKHVQMAQVAMQNLDGSKFDSGGLAGKPVVLNFWAPWCPPCRFEMPWLEKLQREHPELVVIGVEDDPGAYWAAMHMEGREKVNYPLVQNSDAVQSEFGQVVSLPTTLYISRSGKVLHTVSGLVPEMLMTHYAEEAIKAE